MLPRLLVVATVVWTITCKKYEASIGKEIVEDINKLQSDWEAMDPSENPFAGLSDEELRETLGIQKEPFSFLNKDVEEERASFRVDLPDSFDARKKWP